MSNEVEVVKIIAEQLVVDREIITRKSELVDDLGADSLDLVELIMALEEYFDIEIADEVAEKITTVGGVIDGVDGMTI